MYFNSHHFLKIKVFSLFLLIPFLLFCSAKKQIDAEYIPLPVLESQLSETQNDKKNSPTENTEEVILHVYAKGNRINVILKNNLKKALRISPLDFAIIKDKKLTIYNSTIARCEFPVGELKPGLEFNGWFTFLKFDDLTGARLVFNNPGYKPIYTDIEKYH